MTNTHHLWPLHSKACSPLIAPAGSELWLTFVSANAYFPTANSIAGKVTF